MVLIIIAKTKTTTTTREGMVAGKLKVYYKKRLHGKSMYFIFCVALNWPESVRKDIYGVLICHTQYNKINQSFSLNK